MTRTKSLLTAKPTVAGSQKITGLFSVTRGSPHSDNGQQWEALVQNITAHSIITSFVRFGALQNIGTQIFSNCALVTRWQHHCLSWPSRKPPFNRTLEYFPRQIPSFNNYFILANSALLGNAILVNLQFSDPIVLYLFLFWRQQF